MNRWLDDTASGMEASPRGVDTESSVISPVGNDNTNSNDSGQNSHSSTDHTDVPATPQDHTPPQHAFPSKRRQYARISRDDESINGRLQPSSASLDKEDDRSLWGWFFGRDASKKESVVKIMIACLFAAILISLIAIVGELANKQKSSDSGDETATWTDFQVTTYYGAVASDQTICSAMGADILSLGGNAVDAAVTTILCNGVSNPASSGIGGGCFILIYNASNSSSVFIDSRETAPGNATADMFVGKNATASQHGGLAVATPAELKGLKLAFDRYGSGAVSWSQVVSPVAALAESMTVTKELAVYISYEKTNLQSGAYPGLSALLLRSDGSLKQAGDTIERPELANTFTMVHIA
jgi:hypothetical protein